jgi:hypothetical protein
VSIWSRHAHLQTTELYLRADPKEKIEAIEAVTPPPLRRGQVTIPDELITLTAFPWERVFLTILWAALCDAAQALISLL